MEPKVVENQHLELIFRCPDTVIAVMAARLMAAAQVAASLSYLVAIRRTSLRRQKARSAASAAEWEPNQTGCDRR